MDLSSFLGQTLTALSILVIIVTALFAGFKGRIAIWLLNGRVVQSSVYKAEQRNIWDAIGTLRETTEALAESKDKAIWRQIETLNRTVEKMADQQREMYGMLMRIQSKLETENVDA